MKYISLFILILVWKSAKGFLTPEQETYLDDFIESEIWEANKIPGLGIVIVKQSRENEDFQGFTKGYGFSDLEVFTPVFDNTKFLIASISKSFTATVTSRFLSERFPEHGDAVLDIPIVQLAPNYDFVLSDRFRTERTTFRDLLSHRTCLNSYGLGVSVGAFSTRQERIYRYRYLPEKCGFRSRFEYSNNMLILTGDIVAHLSGIPFDTMVLDFMRSLGMNDSIIMDDVTDYENMANMSRGYYLPPDGILRKMNATLFGGNSGAASGGVITTLRDMAKYMEFHLRNGMLNGEQIVPKSIMKWLRHPSNLMEFSGWRTENEQPEDGDFAYGLGLDLGVYRGWQRISHDGDLPPFVATMSLYPTQKLGIFSCSNGPGPLLEDRNHPRLRNEVFDLLFSETFIQSHRSQKPEATRPNSEIPRSKSIRSPKPKIQANELAGLYGHPYESTFVVSYDETNQTHPLSLEYGSRGIALLVETNETNVFAIEWQGLIVTQFYADSPGQPLPLMRLDFNTPDVAIYMDSDGEIEYRRNATLDTFPRIPWDPESCGPKN